MICVYICMGWWVEMRIPCRFSVCRYCLIIKKFQYIV
jgi:hypothetical protein